MDVRFNGVEALTFDFYGTLVYHRTGRGRGATLMAYLGEHGLESDSWEHQVLYDVFESHGREYSPEFSAKQKQDYYAAFARNVFRRLQVQIAPEHLAEHALAIWHILGPACLAVFPDAIPALAALHRAGYPMIVVSNWQCGLAHFVTELQLSSWFRHVLASAEVGSQKPDRRIFEEASRLHEVPPSRILHVGDTHMDDYAGGTEAGFQVVLVNRDCSVPSDAAPMIATLADVPRLLLG